MAVHTKAQIEAALKRNGGDLVVFGGVKTWGAEKFVDEVMELEGQLVTVGRSRTVLIATGILPNLDRGATIVVGGTTYVITDHRSENDGLETRLWLGDSS